MSISNKAARLTKSGQKHLKYTLFAIAWSLPLQSFAFLCMNAANTLQGPKPAWTKQDGAYSVTGGTIDVAVAAADASGNVYVAGATNKGLDGNAQTGTKDFFVAKYNSSGIRQWTKQLGVATKSTQAWGAATDSTGNVFVAGETSGNLDGNTLTGVVDFFVTKYDSTGTRLWTKQLGVASKFAEAFGVATDSSGNIIVVGETNGGLDGNTLTGYYDFFVTKYNSSGTKQWTKQLGATGSSTEGYSVAADPSGNIYVVGLTDGALDGNTQLGFSGGFITKYDASGTKQWTKLCDQFNVPDSSAQGVTTDSAGNIFVAGWTDGGMDGNTLTGAHDFFVTKYDTSGTTLWTRQMGVASQDTFGNAVTSDSFGNVYVAGDTTGGLDGNSLTGTQDFFVTKYASGGQLQWTKQMGSTSQSTTPDGVAIDSSGRLYLSGTTTGGLDNNTLTGATDFFVSQYIGN